MWSNQTKYYTSLSIFALDIDLKVCFVVGVLPPTLPYPLKAHRLGILWYSPESWHSMAFQTSGFIGFNVSLVKHLIAKLIFTDTTAAVINIKSTLIFICMYCCPRIANHLLFCYEFQNKLLHCLCSVSPFIS